MLRIERHLLRLLLNHDCIILPGLGGFVAHYQSAYCAEDNGLFYPPVRTIAFNEQLKMNDGLLVQSYMQAYDTSYIEAMQFVKEDCNKIKKAISNSGSYELYGIGRLSQNANGSLCFSPATESGIEAPEFYGLDAFSTTLETIAIPQETTDETPVTIIEAETPHDILQDAEPEEEETKRHYIIRLNRWAVHYGAVAILTILFYFAFAVPVTDSMQPSGNNYEASGSALYTFPLQTVVNHKSTPAKEQTIAAQSADTLNNTTTQAAAPVANEQPADYYTIVLASCIKQSNAEDFIQRLSAKGHNEAQYYTSGKMTRITYARFASQEEAEAALHALRAECRDFAEAWVLHIKS